MTGLWSAKPVIASMLVYELITGHLCFVLNDLHQCVSLFKTDDDHDEYAVVPLMLVL